MRTRDFQKQKVSKFGKSFDKQNCYDSLESAQSDLNLMHQQMVELLGITDELLIHPPTILKPHGNRKNVSVYRPANHCIVLVPKSTHKRKLIHEMCHSLNKTVAKGKRRTVGASHGIEYTTIYIFALGAFYWDFTRFDFVESVANEFGCQYDKQWLEQLKTSFTQSTQSTQSKQLSIQWIA